MRLDAATTSATRLLFCTTGILLRRLASDAALARVSHVIVDEVRPQARSRAHSCARSASHHEPQCQQGCPVCARPCLQPPALSFPRRRNSTASSPHCSACACMRVPGCPCRRRREQRPTPPGLRAGARAHAAGRLPDDAAARHRREPPRRWQPSEGAAQYSQGSSFR